MKSIFAFLIGIASCFGAAAADSVIKVDDAHLQVARADGGKPETYVVQAGASLLVDASNYSFKMPPQLSNMPINSLQLVLGKTEQYSAAWTPSTRRLLLSKESLSPNPGSKPFAGFASGQRGVVAIGRMEGSNFSVVWVGMLVVQ